MFRFLTASLLAVIAMTAYANNSVTDQGSTIKVGVRDIPPFAFRVDDGQWAGISVELWQNIADAEGWEISWRPASTVQDQIKALQSNDIDVAVGAVSMTPERERLIDFSHSFFTTSLAIATPERDSSWVGLLDQVASPAFIKAVSALMLLLFAVGALMWLIERRRNPDHFGGSMMQGLGNGFWWSAVTMTTVGYGDKAPVSGLGRVIATIWMFVSVITISGFTAAIASSVTLDSAKSRVSGLADLDQVRSLAVTGSTGAQMLSERRIPFRPVDDPSAGLASLQADAADALVYDEAILRFLVKDIEQAPLLIAVPGTSQNYAFGLRVDLPQTEAINRQLLTILDSAKWMEIRERYFGPQSF